MVMEWRWCATLEFARKSEQRCAEREACVSFLRVCRQKRFR